jgi:hypothetical protein
MAVQQTLGFFCICPFVFRSPHTIDVFLSLVLFFVAICDWSTSDRRRSSMGLCGIFMGLRHIGEVRQNVNEH